MNKVKTIIISFAICIAWICILNTSVVHAEVNVKPSTYATSYLYNAQRLTLGEETSQFFTSEEGEDGKYTGYLGYAVSFTTGSKNSFYEITEINRFGNSVTFELYDADKVIITGKTKSISASGKNTMSLKLDKNSTYYILAYTRNMANVAPGDVSILVKEINDDCGDTFKSATTISIGKTVNGKIDGYGDVDIYKFKTKADNGYYAIDFINTDSEAFLAMNLFDTKEVEKKYVYVQTGKQSQIYMQLKKNSTYYLHVESKTANITGKYKIKVSYHEDPEGDTVKTAYKLKIKAKAYNGSLQDKDDNDTFRVDTGNLTKINIVIANKKSDGKLNYNIIEKDGNRIKYGTIDAGRTMDIIVDGLRRNKDYYIVLTGPQHLNYAVVIAVQKGTSFSLSNSENKQESIMNHSVCDIWMSPVKNKIKYKSSKSNDAFKLIADVKGNVSITPELYGKFIGKFVYVEIDGCEYSMFAGIRVNDNGTISEKKKRIISNIAKSMMISSLNESVRETEKD